jgi:hypothetical protein
MKVFTTIFLLLFALAVRSNAQASFSLTPQMVATSVPDSITDAEGTNTIQNLEGVSKTIRWTRSVICINPAAGYTQICDINVCYSPSVSTKTFVLGPNASGPMITHFLKDAGIQGSAIVTLHFENTVVKSDSLTSFYLFNSCSITGTKEQLPEANVQLFPNPVTEFFTLRNADAVSSVSMYTTDGREVASFTATPDARYNIATLPAASYFVALFDKDKRVFQALKIDKR